MCYLACVCHAFTSESAPHASKPRFVASHEAFEGIPTSPPQASHPSTRSQNPTLAEFTSTPTPAGIASRMRLAHRAAPSATTDGTGLLQVPPGLHSSRHLGRVSGPWVFMTRTYLQWGAPGHEKNPPRSVGCPMGLVFWRPAPETSTGFQMKAIEFNSIARQANPPQVEHVRFARRKPSTQAPAGSISLSVCACAARTHHVVVSRGGAHQTGPQRRCRSP